MVDGKAVEFASLLLKLSVALDSMKFVSVVVEFTDAVIAVVVVFVDVVGAVEESISVTVEVFRQFSETPAKLECTHTRPIHFHAVQFSVLISPSEHNTPICDSTVCNAG